MPRIAVAGELFGAVPIISRHLVPRNFTHLFASKAFYAGVKNGDVIWSANETGKPWGAVEARFKSPGGTSIHSYGHDLSLLSADTKLFEARTNVEIFVNGHILGFTSPHDGDDYVTILDVDAEAKDSFQASAILLDGGVVAPGPLAPLVERNKDLTFDQVAPIKVFEP